MYRRRWLYLCPTRWSGNAACRAYCIYLRVALHTSERYCVYTRITRCPFRPDLLLLRFIHSFIHSFIQSVVEGRRRELRTACGARARREANIRTVNKTRPAGVYINIIFHDVKSTPIPSELNTRNMLLGRFIGGVLKRDRSDLSQ